ncbi:hypothetical protein AUC69_08150 [Methyloceanibacter superfactus]|jgi:hypothetical protein|uniref:Uncharacterized protein n=1 Tax=Methyloceanibacter superfactus TaxID=1774969 RepID=A0A1E3W1H4_9HYPH|nr:hypothetical protein [Methyloceanibacter superfactus]ODR99599.1 hypothetical protein AUC69_08150 [Methyloceanibacter superfactus]
MAMLPALRKALPRAAIVAAALFALAAVDTTEAQQRRGDGNGYGNGASSSDRGRTRGVGGTSWTLSDVWGEPKMPPPANDFGPGFDYQGGGYNLNGVPNQSPYPN